MLELWKKQKVCVGPKTFNLLFLMFLMFLLFPIHFKYSAKNPKGHPLFARHGSRYFDGFLEIPLPKFATNVPTTAHSTKKTYISSKVFQVFQHMDTMFASGPTFDISTLQMSSTTKHAVSPVPPINPTKSPWGWSPISVVPALHPAFVAPLQLVAVPKEWPRWVRRPKETKVFAFLKLLWSHHSLDMRKWWTSFEIKQAARNPTSSDCSGIIILLLKQWLWHSKFLKKT